MRTRAGNWLLLVGLSGWACTPSTPRRPPAPAARDSGSAAQPAFVPPTTDGAVAVTDSGGATSDASDDVGNACRPLGPESTAAACGNGSDDDCDGQSDCRDQDCLNVRGAGCDSDASAPRPPTSNCIRRGPENTNEACGNRLDDDCDGYSDCADQDCAPPAVTVCPPRPPAPAPVRAPAPAAARPVAPVARPAVRPAPRPAAPAARP